MKTSAQKAAWSRQYLVALRRHLQSGPAASVPSAQALGRRALALGLETLDVVRTHEQALAALALPGKSSRTARQTIEPSQQFFTETLAPIEHTHRAAQKADARVNRLTQTLCRRTLEASDSTRRLKRTVVQRQLAEAALSKSEQHRTRLMTESRRLQQHLRHLTHEILAAQEDERRKTSHQLHDEIAQTLLAIHVRLLTLKKGARDNTESLKKEIAETQRLVKQSVKTIRRLAHEFEGPS